ncbi:FecCD family ABC transporter permease [Lacticaseibacillus yichunensis]|uniref:FecCD family ABC transporter permease n=1 Tax=Lacticaseibacillus yichunensis TaxID=2486015 RepID=A0ABW4CQ46_9LACO|nr:iron ABC transporter permease [Lacticaseibacillus yichunensis]
MTPRRSFQLVLLSAVGLLLAALLCGAMLGSVTIAPHVVLKAMVGQAGPDAPILWTIRFPRVVFSALAGVALAVSGLLLQSVLKNPLADPGIMGISSGAALGAVIVLLVVPVASGVLPLIAFGAGMAAFGAIVVLSWDRQLSPVRLILAGVAVNAMFGVVQAILMTLYSDRLHGVIGWLNGDLSGKSWGQVGLVAAYTLPVLAVVWWLRPLLTLLVLDDEALGDLGIPVRRVRLGVASLAVLLAASVVAQAGLISFVGLIVPHFARLLVGSNYRRLLPLTMVAGALVVTAADTVARLVAAPIEIPIGTVMAIVGGPVFLGMLGRRKGAAHDSV